MPPERFADAVRAPPLWPGFRLPSLQLEIVHFDANICNNHFAIITFYAR